MQITYHGQNYEIEQREEKHVSRWLAARELPRAHGGAYRIFRNGAPQQGGESLVYPDEAAANGYQIVPEELGVSVGEEIQVGTGYLNNGIIGKVTAIGCPYYMAIDVGVADEDHSNDGFRAKGYRRIIVHRVYFDKV